MPENTEHDLTVDLYGDMTGLPSTIAATIWQYNIIRYIPQKERDSYDEADFAGPGRSFPITSQHQLEAAAHLIGHADNPAAVKAKAIRIAKRKGFTLPDSWKSDSEKEDRMDTPTEIEAPELETIPEQVPEEASTSSEETPTTPETEPERSDMPTQAFLHADIIRIDKNKREVTGVATSEAVDTFGTVFSYEASKKAFQRWIERTANVREMHQKKAVAKGIGVEFDDEGKRIYVTTRVSRSADGDNAWTKIEEGILNGFSVGASNDSAVWSKTERNGRKYPYLVGYELAELSLVDNASNPDAHGLLIARVDGLVEEVIDITEPDVPEQTTPSQSIVSSPDSSSTVSVASSDLERAGARVSSKSKSALHDARNSSMRSSMSLMNHCGCDQCQSLHDALDPDNDGDIDFMGMDDPDGDATSLGMARSQETDLKHAFDEEIEGIIERVLSSKITSFIQRQQSVLTRFASIDIPVPEVPEVHFDPELIRSVISAEISSLVTPLEERLTSALESLNTTSSLSEVRSVLTEVRETVERIASQPAAGGPILNGGHPIDKRLANSPMPNTQIDPRSFWDEAQKRGLLNTPELQMQAAAATAIPMQVRR